MRVTLVVSTLSPGAAQADRHIVLAEHGDNTLTVHLGKTEETSARWASSVHSHVGASEETRSRKKKRDKRKKKKSRRRHSSSGSTSVRKGRRNERSANHEVVSEPRASLYLAEQTEAYGTEAHGLSPSHAK